MTGSYDLEEIEKSSRRAVHEDGLTYIFLSLLILVLGVTFTTPTLGWLAGLGIFLIFPAEIARRWITYPRIGYVRFTASPGTIRGILGFAVIAVIGLAILAFAGEGRFQPYLPLAFSAVFALSYYFAASTYGIRTVDWLVIVLILATGILAIIRYDDWRSGTSMIFTVTGLALLSIGIVNLLRFLRKYPVLPVEEAEEES